MAVTELLQELQELCYGLGDLHVGQVALEEDGALGPLRAFVVQSIGGAGDIIAGSRACCVFFLGHR
jgi:hypothetical protein